MLPRTWTLLREATNVLLEGVREGIDLDAVEQALLALPGITGVHDLHVWALSSGRVALTAHIEADDRLRREERLEALAGRCWRSASASPMRWWNCPGRMPGRRHPSTESGPEDMTDIVCHNIERLRRMNAAIPSFGSDGGDCAAGRG